MKDLNIFKIISQVNYCGAADTPSLRAIFMPGLLTAVCDNDSVPVITLWEGGVMENPLSLRAFPVPSKNLCTERSRLHQAAQTVVTESLVTITVRTKSNSKQVSGAAPLEGYKD
jgi:hypothetical protein